MRGFHGRTMGALSATYNKKYKEAFEPLVPGFSHVAYNNIAALEGAVTDQVAAVILEAVQGEGGRLPGRSGLFAGRPPHLHGTRRVVDPGRDPGRAGAHRKNVRLPTFRHHARYRLHCEIAGRRSADGCRVVWRFGQEPGSRPAWFDLRRKSAGLCSGAGRLDRHRRRRSCPVRRPPRAPT